MKQFLKDAFDMDWYDFFIGVGVGGAVGSVLIYFFA